MRKFRLLGYAAAALALLLGVAMAIAFSSSFQTWAARRALAKNSDWRGVIGSVDAGWRHVQARDVRLERRGVVITLPSLEVDLPVYAALVRERVTITRLVAKGWTIDLSRATAPANGEPAPASAGETRKPSEVPASAAAGPEAVRTETARAFEGVFAHLGLPVDLAVSGVELEGEVILPAMRGRTKVTVRGGGLAAGSEGKFELTSAAALRDRAVDTLAAQGNVTVTMDTPRTLARIAARLEANARGAQFPAGVKLTLDASAARAAAGETYSLALISAERPLVRAHADWPTGGKRLNGSWNLDVSDADVAPFALGLKLPALALAGEGSFETEADFSMAQGRGHVKAAVSRLETLERNLSEVGPLTIDADFDLARRGEAVVVTKLDAQIGAAKPVARVQAVQAFEFNPRTRALLATEPSRDLATVALEGAPLAWAQPFLGSVSVTGDDVRGRFVVAARSGGMTVRSEAPLTIGNAAVAGKNGPWIENADVSTHVSADYAPRGWQVELAGLTASVRGAEWLRLEAKAGQLAGQNEPVKTTGRLTLALPALIAQPALRDLVTLARGRGTVEFAATLAAKAEVHAKIALEELAATVAAGEQALPALTLEARADVAPNGQIEINAPLTIVAGERRSDLQISGTLTPKAPRVGIDARVTGARVFINDLQAFAVVAKADKTREPAAAPVWANYSGSVALQLGRVVYANAFEATDVTGTLRFDGGAVKLELVRAGLGENGEARVNGEVTYDAKAPQPYALAADLAVTEFDLGALLRGLYPGQAPVVEGRFNFSGRIVSRGPALGGLVSTAAGDVRVTSRGGTFRGLPLNVSHLVENQGKIAGWIASASATISAMAGKRDENDVASKVQAASELAKGLYPLPYDQLSVLLSRDAALNAQLKDFTLISPEVRLAGNGRTTHRPDTSLLNDSLAMEFTLRAQGRPAQMLKYLGALEAQKDDFGYAACTLPIKIGGTMGKPDGTELSNRVVALVLEKSGFIDKAMELFGKRGKQASAAPDPR